MTLAQYMQEVLTNPVSGYYMKGDVFGPKGDFITSPEISQMFGECLGIWIINEWLKMCRPKPLQLVELGPGRGTLMRDILRTFLQICPEDMDKVSVHLVEASENMSKIQEAMLCGYFHGHSESNGDSVSHKAISKQGNEVNWYKDILQVPKGFTFFLAHEFFDAMPIHQFVKDERGWHEVLVDVQEFKQELTFVKSRERSPNCILINPEESRTEVELSPRSAAIVREICSRIVESGGGALIADYGHNGEKSNTFRAFKNHKLCDPLEDPGNSDLTADVDFNYLKNSCSDEVLVYGPEGQRLFLHRLGIELRKDRLLQSCTNTEIKSDLESSYHMLTDKDQMGQRFKFMSIFPATMKPIHVNDPPAGFNPLKSISK